MLSCARNQLRSFLDCGIIFSASKSAEVMELADVTDSKSVGSNTVWVRVPPSAPFYLRFCRRFGRFICWRIYAVTKNGYLIAIDIYSLQAYPEYFF